MPVYEAIFEMASRKVPNPREAQAYRIEEIWDGQVNSPIGKALVGCSDDGPAVFCVTNVHSDGKGGTVATGRLFSGKLMKGTRLHLVDALAETTVNQVTVDMGSLREEVDWVSAGNLASLNLSGEVKAGETLVDVEHKADMVPFEGISYVSEPVVTLAVEPKNPKDIPLLLGELEKLSAEDPNLKVTADQETGEYLLSGMGELHLEVAINQLKSSSGLDVTVSSPRVVYMESVEAKRRCGVGEEPQQAEQFLGAGCA